jgi:hypothetical protein
MSGQTLFPPARPKFRPLKNKETRTNSRFGAEKENHGELTLVGGGK